MLMEKRKRYVPIMDINDCIDSVGKLHSTWEAEVEGLYICGSMDYISQYRQIIARGDTVGHKAHTLFSVGDTKDLVCWKKDALWYPGSPHLTIVAWRQSVVLVNWSEGRLCLYRS